MFQVVSNGIKLIPFETISITPNYLKHHWRGREAAPFAAPNCSLLSLGYRNSFKWYQFDSIWNNLEHFKRFQNCFKFVSCHFCMPLPLARLLAVSCSFHESATAPGKTHLLLARGKHMPKIHKIDQTYIQIYPNIYKIYNI